MPVVAAIRAAPDMPAERGRAAVLDGRHAPRAGRGSHAGVGSPPGGAMTTKDVCDLQASCGARRAGYARRRGLPRGQRREPVERAARRCGSWCWRRGSNAPSCRAWRGRAAAWITRMSVSCSEQVRGEAVPQRVRRHPLLDPGCLGGGWTARRSWRVDSGSTGFRRPGRPRPAVTRCLPNLASPHCARSNGSSMPSDLLADPTPSSPTFPATHTALLLPIAGSSPSPASASLSNGRITGPRATPATSL